MKLNGRLVGQHKTSFCRGRRPLLPYGIGSRKTGKPTNQSAHLGGSNVVWPESLILWAAAFPMEATSNQLAHTFALPQAPTFSPKSSENSLFTCEFCSFRASNQSHLMNRVTNQHKQLLNSAPQSNILPLDGSSGFGLTADG